MCGDPSKQFAQGYPNVTCDDAIMKTCPKKAVEEKEDPLACDGWSYPAAVNNFSDE